MKNPGLLAEIARENVKFFRGEKGGMYASSAHVDDRKRGKSPRQRDCMYTYGLWCVPFFMYNCGH